VNQPRGTQRYQPTQREDEDRLTQAIIELASQYGRYGYPCIRSCLIRCSPTIDTIQHRLLAHGLHCAMTHLSM
jgi:hypothetical protein